MAASDVSYSILASNGTRGSDVRSSITLNIRSFSEGDASGHGLSCSSTLSGFDPGGGGEEGRRRREKDEERNPAGGGKV